MWKRVTDLKSCQKLYHDVTPESDRDETLFQRFYNYRAYCFDNNGQIEAFGVVCFLPISDTIMIDLFAIDPSVRGKGLARNYFNTFIEQLGNLWPECSTARYRRLLEAYIHNIEPWCKIMDMKISDVQMDAKKLGNPVKLLVHNIHNTEDIIAAYKEWQFFQDQW